MKINENLLDNCLNDIIGKKYVFSTVMRVENGDGTFVWENSKGEMKSNSKYFIASVTKLYVTAVVMSLIEENKLNLDEKIAKYLPNHYMEKLHVYKSVEYSNEITIKHLISNTSGIPDYFFYKEHGKSFSTPLFQGKDETWEVEKTIHCVKKMKPKFTPGQKGKVEYSDTNYQLLGKIIEVVTGMSINKVFEENIFNKLGFCNTYVYNDIADNEPTAFYYKAKRLWLPNYMASVAVEGGIVSTAEEVMIFLKEFFKGRFFQKEKLEELKRWNLLLPPPGMFYFGIGLEKMPTPRIISPFKPIKELIGFWGQTSAFAWYNSDTDLYFTGTANQVNGVGHMAVGNSIFKIIKSVL
jgi:CubicO group peptidase (beta-lactamase class C family)